MLSLMIFFISYIESGTLAARYLTLQTGASVTIPCHYDMKYLQHKKYLCYNHNSQYNSCTIQAYANNTEGKVTVTDNPAESLFTVTMRDLQEENTGMYWCAVEITGIWPDITEDLYITVKSEPDVSVLESRVRGEEGGNITIQCLYRASFKNTQKQWCRFKDWSCYSVGETSTSQNSAIQISDDGRSSFTVQMTGLKKKSDAGWYWCSAGDLEVPVHLNVTDPPAVLTTVTVTTRHDTTWASVSKDTSAASMTAVSGTKETIEAESNLYWPLIVLVLLMLLILVLAIIYTFKKKNKVENPSSTPERRNNPTPHTTEGEISYISVGFKSRVKKSEEKNLQQRSSGVVEDGIIYSSLVF